MVNLNLVSNAFKGGFSIITGSWRELFRENMKVILLGLLFALVAALLLGIPSAVAAGMLLGAEAGMWAGALIGIFAGVLVYSGAISATYNVVDEVAGKARHSALGNLKRNMLPVVVYTLILLALIYGIGYSPRLVLLLAGIQNFALNIVLDIYETAVSFVIGFLLLFALFELVVGRAGVLQCMGRSFSLVKGNLLETIVFYVLYGLYALVAALVLLFVLGIIFILPVLVGAVAVGALGLMANPVVAMVLVGIVVLLALAFVLVYYAASITLTLPVMYRYWGGIRKG